jgi:hypothetical protein
MADRPMTSPERQMPAHVEAAYKDAVDNTIFLKRQQWVATKRLISSRHGFTGFTGPTSTERSKPAWICRSGHNRSGPNWKLPPGLSLSHSSDLF